MAEGVLIAKRGEIEGLKGLIEVGKFDEKFGTFRRLAREWAYRQLARECRSLGANIACIDDETHFADTRRYDASGRYLRFPD